jgi:hypothetical protein
MKSTDSDGHKSDNEKAGYGKAVPHAISVVSQFFARA